MTEVEGIQEGSNIKPVNEQKKREQDVYTYSQRKKQKPYSLRIGEIVQGKITSEPEDNIAMVELPVGTLKAYLHGRLKKGDSLFFKIQEITPSLTLRIYSITPVSKGIEYSNEEIIRILDLPENKIINNIISFLKISKSSILRDEVLVLDKSFSALEKNITESYQINDILKGLLFIEDAKLPLNQNLFNRILPAIIGTKNIYQLLKQFEQIINKGENLYFVKFREIFTTLRSGSYTSRQGMELFCIEPVQNNKLSNFFYTLLEFIQTTSTKDTAVDLVKSRTIARLILESIEGQYIINSLSNDYNTPMYFVLPFTRNGNYFLVQLVLRKHEQVKPNEKQYHRLSIIAFTDNLGEIVANCDFAGTNINLEFLMKDDKIKDLINSHLNDLSASFENNKTKIQNITLKTVEEQSLNLSSNLPQMQSISVVI